MTIPLSYDDDIRQTQIQELRAFKREGYNFQRWLLDDFEEINYLQNAIRGIMLNTETGQYELEDGTQLMNTKGARVLTETYLLPIIKNAKLSNFTPEQIDRIMLKVMKELSDHLYLNSEKYQISFENKGLILNLFENYIFAVLNRALYGAEQERLGTTQKVISEERIDNRVGNQTPQEQNGGRRGLRDWLPM